MSDLTDFPMQRKAMRPTFRTWLKHFFWFFLTFITLTLTGSIGFLNTSILPNAATPQNFVELINLILSIPSFYFYALNNLFSTLNGNYYLLLDGVIYAVCLLFILTSHEAGHYIACRIYGVDATLPLFIPSPPLIAFGSFGAFIKIVSPSPSKSAVFDIGVAGPLAGFVASTFIAFFGIFTAKTVPIQEVMIPQGEVIFTEPLSFQLIHILAGHNLTDAYYQNSLISAAWIGFLITWLNLLPSGQLDGGHAIYAVFGGKIHKWVGRFAFIIMTVLTIVGWYYFNSPTGILTTVILGVMLFVGHPNSIDDQTPLDFKRKIIAIITLIVFILSFMPFPIKIS